MILYYSDITGAISPTEGNGFLPVHEGNRPEPISGYRIEQDRIIPCEGGYVMTYKQVQLPNYAAGEWLELVGYGAAQQPTLLYLKMNLATAGKQSDKLNAVEAYINKILIQYATDPAPRNDWPEPPYTYHETISEAVELLKP